jgi:hypothetical protein
MKKKERGLNFRIIQYYLRDHGATGAADIQKATKIKGNIYTTLQTMLGRKLIKKVGKLYVLDSPPWHTPITSSEIDNSDSLDGEKASKAVHQSQPTPNPYANILKREHEHIMEGIKQLQISANYLNLRIRELERVN